MREVCAHYKEMGDNHFNILSAGARKTYKPTPTPRQAQATSHPYIRLAQRYNTVAIRHSLWHLSPPVCSSANGTERNTTTATMMASGALALACVRDSTCERAHKIYTIFARFKPIILHSSRCCARPNKARAFAHPLQNYLHAPGTGKIVDIRATEIPTAERCAEWRIFAFNLVRRVCRRALVLFFVYVYCVLYDSEEQSVCSCAEHKHIR